MSDQLDYRVTITTDQGEVTWDFNALPEATSVFAALEEGKAAQPCTVRLLNIENNRTIDRFETAAPKRPVNYQETLERLSGSFLLVD